MAVVGTSAAGNLRWFARAWVPALERGGLAVAGSRWRLATLRPGGDPIGELARNTAATLEIPESDARADLARSSLRLAELVKRNLHPGENLLVVVDQFEELFRYHKEEASRGEREASAAFVKLLLAATAAPKCRCPASTAPGVRSAHHGLRLCEEARNSGVCRRR